MAEKVARDMNNASMANKKHDILMKAIKVTTPSKKKGVIDFGPLSSYPCLYLNVEQVPDLKGREVGEKICFMVEGKITGHNLNENIPSTSDKANKRENFDVQITKIGLEE